MNWKDCVDFRIEMGTTGLDIGNRFSFPFEGWSGFDCKAEYTISDVWGAISWFWTWPGDFMLTEIAANEKLGPFFLIEGQQFTGHWLSSALSFVALVLIVAALDI